MIARVVTMLSIIPRFSALDLVIIFVLYFFIILGPMYSVASRNMNAIPISLISCVIDGVVPELDMLTRIDNMNIPSTSSITAAPMIVEP